MLLDLQTYEGQICTDCVLLVANGDTSGYPGDVDEYLRRVDAGYGSDVETVVVGTGDAYFSWSACDLCNTRLGGDRMDATFFLRQEP